MTRTHLISGLLGFALLFSPAEGIQSQSAPPVATASPAGQAAPATAQAPQTQPPQPQAQQDTRREVYESATVLKTITRLVVVDVVATDKKGDAAFGLERSDFTLLEDGKEQEIRV